jgi:hypothetical protein
VWFVTKQTILAAKAVLLCPAALTGLLLLLLPLLLLLLLHPCWGLSLCACWLVQILGSLQNRGLLLWALKVACLTPT